MMIFILEMMGVAGVLSGLGAAIAVSLAIFILNSSQPRVVELGRATVKMMNSVLKMRKCVLKTRNCVLKTRNCVLKMMNFAGVCGLPPS